MQKKSPTVLRDWLQARTTDIIWIHFALACIYALYIILSDAWNLIAPELITKRWTMTASLLAFTLTFWIATKYKSAQAQHYRLIIYGIILVDIFFATFAIYSLRGMASRGGILYALPVLVSAILLSRRALIYTTVASTLAYFLAALKYYDNHPNEGYLAEVYIEVGFYCAILFVLTAILWALIHPRKS